jgi:serine/threonine protein kinase
MSPEMLKGDPHNHRLDIYCLGALLYEMLTGLPPHYSRNVNDMYVQIIEDKIEFPLYIADTCALLMKKMLNKNPDKRFQSVEEIKQHEWFEDVDWEQYMNKEVEPHWKPSLSGTNFDPEYATQDISSKTSKRGEAFWMENINSSAIESNFSSRTVTEQSICQSFAYDDNISFAFNIPQDVIHRNNSTPVEPMDPKIDESMRIDSENGHVNLNRFSFN